MAEFVIIPDSGCDLTADLRERFGVPAYVKGVVYFPDGSEHFGDLDWGEITPEDYFNSMRAKNVLYKTACPKRGDVRDTFEKFLKEGKDILSISLSTKLSATYAMTEQVKEELLAEYPDRKIICIDSLKYSTSFALLVVSACMMQKEGKSIDEVAAWCLENRYRIHQMGPMDDLYFLCKTGRVNNFAALFGTLAGINALGDFNREGLANVLTKVKGKKTALEVTVKYIEKMIRNPEDQIIFIAHSIRPEAAQKLKEMLEERVHPKEIILTTVGMSCGANIGPGLCGAFFYGDPISEGNVEEIRVMNEITGKK